LESSIVSRNSATDVSGPFTGSHNLVGTDARLGALTTNEVGTVHLPLMPDSPAIDAALALPGIDVDQRGVARPFGSAPDIGAYEWNGTNFYTSFILTGLQPSGAGWILKGGGPTNQEYRIQASKDLTNWLDVTTNNTGAKGLFQYSEPAAPAEAMRLYRVDAP